MSNQSIHFFFNWLFRLVQRSGTVVQGDTDVLALFIQICGRLAFDEATTGGNLEDLAADVVVAQHPLEGLDHAVDRGEESLGLEFVVKRARADVGPDHVRVDRVHGDLFFR